MDAIGVDVLDIYSDVHSYKFQYEMPSSGDVVMNSMNSMPSYSLITLMMLLKTFGFQHPRSKQYFSQYCNEKYISLDDLSCANNIIDNMSDLGIQSSEFWRLFESKHRNRKKKRSPARLKTRLPGLTSRSKLRGPMRNPPGTPTKNGPQKTSEYTKSLDPETQRILRNFGIQDSTMQPTKVRGSPESNLDQSTQKTNWNRVFGSSSQNKCGTNRCLSRQNPTETENDKSLNPTIDQNNGFKLQNIPGLLSNPKVSNGNLNPSVKPLSVRQSGQTERLR